MAPPLQTLTNTAMATVQLCSVRALWFMVYGGVIVSMPYFNGGPTLHIAVLYYSIHVPTLSPTLALYGQVLQS